MAEERCQKQHEIINLHDEGWWEGQAPCFIWRQCAPLPAKHRRACRWSDESTTIIRQTRQEVVTDSYRT